ncbi:dihydrodipicolinate synthase family protein [Agromyces arachidis]|uniref:dihydrodipicolinate synthase family protein n=1 Tax=Agromyces arachidis TaxID=766966 RepID=UPI0040574521
MEHSLPDDAVRSRFTGLSAFPLTPLRDDAIDEAAFASLVARLAASGVDSITALGSAGSAPYLSREERARAARLAIEHAGDVPVFVGIGALRTSHVQALAEDAQEAGAAGLLLAPLQYQALTADDVFGLYEDVTRDLSVPLIVYDNPGTTHFVFDDELYGRVAALPNVASMKIPPVPGGPGAVSARVSTIRSLLPDHVTIGISGDIFAARGLVAGCDAWYSVIAGVLPETALAIMRAVQASDAAGARDASDALAPLWALFARHGSVRVAAAIAEHLGLVGPSCLPLPIRGLDDDDRAAVVSVMEQVGIDAG